MKRTLTAAAVLATLTTATVAAGVGPAYATPTLATSSAAESVVDYSAIGSAPSLVSGGLQFDGATAGGQGVGAAHTESPIALASLNGLGYDIATAPAAGQADPAYTLDVDTSGAGADVTLTAEPDQNGQSVNAAGTFDVTGWSFWSSGIDASADGGQSNPEPLTWFATQYPSAVVVGHGLQLSSTASSSDAVVSSTSFNGDATDFTVGTEAAPIAASTAPAGATKATSGTVTGIDSQTGVGTETDVWTRATAFGTVYYAVTAPATDPNAVTGLTAPTVVQPTGATVARNGSFTWQESAKGTVTLPAVDGGSWTVDGLAATTGSALALNDGSHSVIFTPGSGRIVYPASIPAGGTANAGAVDFTVTLTPGTASGAAKVTVSRAPSISGTAQVGKTLTANLGTVSPNGATVAYQWLANGATISGAKSKTYTPSTSTYVGKKLSVKVTASLSGYTSYTATSAQTAAVTVSGLTSSTPGIRGTVKVGATLTAVPNTWTSGTSLSYQWFANGRAISGATHSTLGLSSSVYKERIQVRVLGRKSGYTEAVRTSGSTAPVAAGTLTGSQPTISISSSEGGSPIVGATLSANPGHWTAGTAIHYQWYANGRAISGATKSTYKVPANLLGHSFLVRIIGTKTGYTSLGENSHSTAGAVQTLAYYKSHSGNKTTYEAVVTGLEGARGAGPDGDPGEAIVLAGATPDQAESNFYDGDFGISPDGATSWTYSVNVANSSTSIYEAVADPGQDEDGDFATAEIRVYARPAGAPSVYNSLIARDTVTGDEDGDGPLVVLEGGKLVELG